jgi:hypothetical protein
VVPQPSEIVPHSASRSSQDFGLQQLLDLHTLPLPQLLEQSMVPPQPLLCVALHDPGKSAQVLGLQQEPLLQTLPLLQLFEQSMVPPQPLLSLFPHMPG